MEKKKFKGVPWQKTKNFSGFSGDYYPGLSQKGKSENIKVSKKK
jgi:hypothetical protein